MFHLAREVGKFGDVLAEKKVTFLWLVNSNMVKPENSSLSLYSTFMYERHIALERLVQKLIFV